MIIVILIDSQFIIRDISSVEPSKNSSALEYKILTDILTKSGRSVLLQWTPSHCRISGNEFADSLAKTGFDLPQLDLPTSYHRIKRIMTSKFKVSYHKTITNLTSRKIWDSLCDNPISYDLLR